MMVCLPRHAATPLRAPRRCLQESREEMRMRHIRVADATRVMLRIHYTPHDTSPTRQACRYAADAAAAAACHCCCAVDICC